MTTHANPCGAATTWVVWANTWKNTCFGFLGIPFFSFLFYSSARAQPAHVYRFWRSIRHTTCFRPRMCLLGVSFMLLPILGVKSPKKPILGAWIVIFKLNLQNIKIGILSIFLHRLPPNFAQSQRPQVLFVGGPNTRNTNPRWRTAAILKNRQIAISEPRFKRLRQNLACRHSSTLLSVPTVKNLKLSKFKMAPSWIIENRPYLRKVWTDLREIWFDDAYKASEWDRKLKFPTFENPISRRPPSWKIDKSPYLSRGLSDFDKIWHVDAV